MQRERNRIETMRKFSLSLSVFTFLSPLVSSHDIVSVNVVIIICVYEVLHQHVGQFDELLAFFAGRNVHA